jgi:N-acetyl-anhydromuramyl-L-alanine amidase AmpD
MPVITKIVVHCSDSPHRGDTAEDIHRWHLERGWSGIGYHYVIQESGELDYGRPHYWTGSHVRGHNTGSLGICLLGKDYFTPEQFETLEIVINNLLMEYPQAEVLGHRDLDPHKTCPNFNVKEWWNDRRAQL